MSSSCELQTPKKKLKIFHNKHLHDLFKKLNYFSSFFLKFSDDGIDESLELNDNQSVHENEMNEENREDEIFEEDEMEQENYEVNEINLKGKIIYLKYIKSIYLLITPTIQHTKIQF